MDIVTLGAAKSAIKKAVSGLYKPAGQTAFADLPTPAVGNLGYTYIVTDAFTSDSRFTDYDTETQTGHNYPADTEVTVVITGTESPVYKFDALGGIMDGYATKAEVAAIVNDTTASSTSTYSSNKINTEIAAEDIASTTTGINPSITDSANGYVQDVKVYGESRTSKNLLDLSTITEGYAVATNDGSLYADSKSFATNYIDVHAIPAIICHSGSNDTYVWGAFYDRTLNFVSPFSHTKDLPTYIPEDAYYVRISFLIADEAIAMVEVGETPTSYEPYFSGIHGIGDSGSLDVQTCGKNLLNPATIGLYQATSDPSVIRAGYAPIYVHAGTYTLSYNRASTSVTLWITDMSDYSYQQLQPNDQYVVSSGTYIMVRSGLDTVTEFNNIFTNIQLELGTTATAYEPYVSTTAAVTTGLPYCGIPVTTGETYTNEQGQKWLADTASVEGVAKRVYKVTFDGSEDENWTMSGTLAQGSYRALVPIPVTGKNHTNSEVPKLFTNFTQTIVTPDVMYSGTGAIPCATTTGDGLEFAIRIPNISTIEALKTYLASNPLTVIYELATPTTQELTAAEKSALLNLKTYGSTTNLSITDDPFVDIGYLLNTDNGKAVAENTQNIIDRVPFIGSSWIANIPEMHRNIFRGQSLGSTVTEAQLAAIDDGSFDDLYVGDYWTINSTVYRIADMDYYLLKGTYTENYTLGTRKHHIVILPDDGMYETTYNGSQSSAGYYGSVLRSSRTTAQTAINTAFPNMVVTYKECLTTNAGPSYSRSIYDCDVEAMNAYMIYGHPLWFNTVDYSNSPASCFSMRMGLKQFALFRLASEFIEAPHPYWLQDQSASFVASAIYNNPLALQPTTTGVYNRPFFLLGDAS